MVYFNSVGHKSLKWFYKHRRDTFQTTGNGHTHLIPVEQYFECIICPRLLSKLKYD